MGNAVCKPFFTYWFGKKDVRILFLGLDCAGKTTTLYKLKLGEVVTTIPTIGFNVETIEHNNVKLTAWDVGSRDKMRPLWRHYFPNTHAVVFIIDCSDRERFPEALNEVLQPTLAEDELYKVPCLVLANKQDKPSAMTAEDVASAIRKRGCMKNRKWAVFGTSATSKDGDGLLHALEWLTDVLIDSEKDAYLNGITENSDGTSFGDGKSQSKEKDKDPSKWKYFSPVLNVYKWLSGGRI